MKRIVLSFFLCLSVCLPFLPAYAVEPLPSKMEGKWISSSSGNSNWIEAELINQESPTKAKLKLLFRDGCERSGEATTEFKDGAWEFVLPGGRCNSVSVTMKPVEGKKRLEGTYETNNRKGKLFFEW